MGFDGFFAEGMHSGYPLTANLRELEKLVQAPNSTADFAAAMDAWRGSNFIL